MTDKEIAFDNWVKTCLVPICNYCGMDYTEPKDFTRSCEGDLICKTCKVRDNDYYDCYYEGLPGGLDGIGQ